jgi:replicative DNA helicase
MFVHHDIDECDGVESERSEFIIAKNRGGPTGSVKVEFQRNRQRFNEKGVV